ncbi:uncharacterized protein LOC128683537 [Plodia interpunctella]|uniref:uncharacterized protein LOC128683537 n=1 Tax=Plodia interpunctella TaxID=58824 RepID=UPI002368588B|nr:uncharacterized protein LOC128683537 [Plodia interpunctella]
MLTSLCISLCYSIIVSYRLANILIKQAKYDFFGGQLMAFSLCYLIAGVVPIMMAGQRLNNEFIILRVSLAKMNNLLGLVLGSSVHKEVKGFLHFLTMDPLEFKLLSYPIGMAMLPTSFGVVVSYVVIALQFNHVV